MEEQRKHDRSPPGNQNECSQSSKTKQKQTNSVALSPRANYTDWTTATCRRNLVQTFVDRGVSRGQRGGSHTVVNLSFLDGHRVAQLEINFETENLKTIPENIKLWFSEVGKRSHASSKMSSYISGPLWSQEDAPHTLL
jgi:hypothetical protein